MGKNLKGICQRKDGQYYARFVDRRGKRLENYKLCDEAGIKRFCMHALRHTYAAGAIESGMQPKVLQKLLGHASINTTMDRYVHVTDDSLSNGVRQFEGYQIA